MPCTLAYLFEILSGLFFKSIVIEGEPVEPDYSVHRRTDLMAHVGEERSLGLIGLLSDFERLSECLLLHHGFAHLFVDVREAYAGRMDLPVFTVFHVTHARHPEHGVFFRAVTDLQESVGDNRILEQFFTYIVGLYEFHKALAITLMYMIVAELCESLQEWEPLTLDRIVIVGAGREVAYGFIFVHVDIVYTAVIRRQRDHHAVLSLSLFLFLKQTVLQSDAFFHLLLPRLGFFYA